MMRKRNTDERYKKLMAKKQLEREEAERARKQSEKKRLSSNRSVASNAEGMLDVFKSSLSCPKPLVMALKNQTDLNEKTIQAKYVNFRMRNPTGFLGKQALINMCMKGNVNHQEACLFAEKIFKLFARSKGGWSSRFIGFREVVLATENVNKLKAPEEILRWIFRIFDSSGTGFIKTEKIKGMVEIIIDLTVKDCHGDDSRKKLMNNLLRNYVNAPYELYTITEEEFVYDSLNNRPLFNILMESASRPVWLD